jgi:hypothetical protein
MPAAIRIDKERNCIVIELPIEKARPSASGKTKLIGSTHGLVSGEASYSGRSVVVVANAFVYPDQPSKTDKNKSGRSHRQAVHEELDQSRTGGKPPRSVKRRDREDDSSEGSNDVNEKKNSRKSKLKVISHKETSGQNRNVETQLA